MPDRPLLERGESTGGWEEESDDGADDGRLVEHPHHDDDVGEAGRTVQAVASQNALCTHRDGS